MAEAYTSEIRIFPYIYSPLDWAYCGGQLYPIHQNPALYSLIGTLYGGNGQTTFGIPDLRKRAPMGDGAGPGLTPRNQGELLGEGEVTLDADQIPTHSHRATMMMGTGEEYPMNNYPGLSSDPSAGKGIAAYGNNDSPNIAIMAPETIAFAGSSNAHENRQPWLAVSFCICTDGYFPQRS